MADHTHRRTPEGSSASTEGGSSASTDEGSSVSTEGGSSASSADGGSSASADEEASASTDETAPPPVEARLDEIRGDLERATELLVCLDFDGTLAPIVDDPADAAATPANERAVEALVDEPAATTAVVSGRALTDVRDRVGLAITYAGNHGLELSRADAPNRAIHPIARRRAARLDRVCAALDGALSTIPNARVEHKGLTASVHLRRVPDPAREIVRRITADVTDRFGGDAIERSSGKCVIELSPALEWGKGQAVDLIAADRSDDAYVVFVGDDVTDESAFRSVEPDGLGVLVGDRPSRASARLDGPADVAGFLRWLADDGVAAVRG